MFQAAYFDLLAYITQELGREGKSNSASFKKEMWSFFRGFGQGEPMNTFHYPLWLLISQNFYTAHQT